MKYLVSKASTENLPSVFYQEELDAVHQMMANGLF
jgi:hypothetical protein